MKSKHAERMRIYRQSFTGQAKQDYDKTHAESQRTCRSKNKMSKYVVDYFEMLHRNFLIKGVFRKSNEESETCSSKRFQQKKMSYSGLSSSSWYCTSK